MLQTYSVSYCVRLFSAVESLALCPNMVVTLYFLIIVISGNLFYEFLFYAKEITMKQFLCA